MTAIDNERMLSGAAWSAFCDGLKQAGQLVLDAAPGRDALTVAEGYRYLTRLLRFGLESQLESADRNHPAFFSPSHETVKVGGDNPDNRYLRAEINGNHDYRIRGTRGTVGYLSLLTQKGGYERDGRMIATGFLSGDDLHIDDDGRFEIIVSREPMGSNWLPAEAESTGVIVRQTFRDRRTEEPAALTIERLDRGQGPQPLCAERLIDGLSHTLRFVTATSALFVEWAQRYGAAVNRLEFADQQECQSVGGDPNILYYHGGWALAEDEVLVVTLPRIPACETWNLQLNNFWYESLDYRHHRICHNKYTSEPNPDGSVTLVVAHDDPHHPNWLETAHHHAGTWLFRWVRSAERIDPRCQVMSRRDWMAARTSLRDPSVAAASPFLTTPASGHQP